MFSGTNDLSKIHNKHNISLNAPDRFLEACPINYACKQLFTYLVELNFNRETKDIEIILQYPDESINKIDKDFIQNVKKFSYPFTSLLDESSKLSTNNSSQVQFYTFAFTNSNRIRQYGFCRASQNGTRVLCIVSYLPWDGIFSNLLNKLANLINEKGTSILYNFLEALYEYELPEPSEVAHILSHDGLEQYQFICPDRRVIPSMNENRNLMKFFAYFDLDKLIKIFTALLLERHILIVSSDLEKISSCALSLEYLIYPLEWFHAFAPILPEHIDQHIFYQPFPYIYGIHTSIYKRLNASQLNDIVVLLVDKHDVIYIQNERLPKSVVNDIESKLNFFSENSSKNLSRNTGKCADNLLKTDTIKAFQDAVLTIIGNYRYYLYYDEIKQIYKVNDDLYFHSKRRKANNISQNDFYYQFRNTQAFQEFVTDRADYLKNEDKMRLMNDVPQKDFIEFLFEKFNQETDNPFKKIFKESKKKLEQVVKKTNTVKDRITEKANEIFQANENFVVTNNNYSINNLKNEVNDAISTSSLGSTCDENKKSSVNTDSESTPETKPTLESKTSLTASLSSITSSFSSTTNEPKDDSNRILPLVDLNLTKDPDIQKFIIPQNSQEKKNETENLLSIDDNLLFNETLNKQILNPTQSNFTSISSFNETKSSNYQSIINEFDPIVNNTYKNLTLNVNNNSIQNINDDSISSITKNNNNNLIQSNTFNFLPKPFQTTSRFPITSTSISTGSTTYYPIMSSSTTAASLQTQATTSSIQRPPNYSLNPFAATPFYGQRHQFQFHSVAYPNMIQKQQIQGNQNVQNSNNQSNK